MPNVTRLEPVKGRKPRRTALPQALEKVRAPLLERAGGLVSAMLDGADDVLFDMAEQETDSERARYFDAMRELRVQRAGIEAGFQAAIHASFQNIRAAEEERTPVHRVDAESLSLVGEEDLETQVALDNLARRARHGCEEALRAFRHRLEYLFEGKCQVPEQRNPLEPRNMAAGFAGCLERLSLDIRARLIVLKLFERGVMAETGALVAEANQVLADAGVLPEMTAAPTGRARPAGRSAARSPADPTREAASADRTLADRVWADSASPDPEQAENHMFGLLQDLLATLHAPSGTAVPSAVPSSVPSSASSSVISSAASPVLPTGEERGSMAVLHQGVPWLNGTPAPEQPVEALSRQDLFGLLTRLQRLELAMQDNQEQERSVQRELSDLLEAEHDGEALHALEQADDDVINLVSMLFGFILDDDGLAPDIKALIGRLQIPLLKVAIADKTFFSNEHHDARLLLNTLARAGCQWDPHQGTDDELYQRIDHAVHAVIERYDEDPTLFRDLLDEFERYFEDQRIRAERVAERVREAEEGKARARQAREVARDLVESRLGGRELPAVTVQLLRKGWQSVLALCWLRDGEDSDNWQRQTKVVDALVWSTLPHRHRSDLEKLSGVAPALRRALRQGLEAIQHDGKEIDALLAALKAVHDKLLKGLDTERTAVPVAAAATSDAESGGTKPPTAASRPALPDDHELVIAARHLPVGQWMELGEGDAARRIKLAANIRGGRKLVFINRRGIKVEEFDAPGLAQVLDDGVAKLVPDGALFDRALEAVIGDLRRLQASH